MLFSMEPMDGVAKTKSICMVAVGKIHASFCQSIEKDDLIVMGI